jgi:hypothetical protein
MKMKRCAQCHGRLGLGVRFRNIWNGHWWVHLGFCSTQCERLYELYQSEASARDRWYSFLARGGPPLRPLRRRDSGSGFALSCSRLLPDTRVVAAATRREIVQQPLRPFVPYLRARIACGASIQCDKR